MLAARMPEAWFWYESRQRSPCHSHGTDGSMDHLKAQTSCQRHWFLHTFPQENAEAANQVKMAQILELTHSIRTPFVIVAGFNVEPDQLWETGWVQIPWNRYSRV